MNLAALNGAKQSGSNLIEANSCGSSGVIRLPAVARPRLRVCVIGDQYDIDRARHLRIDAVSLDDLKKLNKNKKLVKKFAGRYEP